MSFKGISGVYSSFIEFYTFLKSLKSFTEMYKRLQSFTEFYRVSRSLMQFDAISFQLPSLTMDFFLSISIYSTVSLPNFCSKHNFLDIGNDTFID